MQDSSLLAGDARRDIVRDDDDHAPARGRRRGLHVECGFFHRCARNVPLPSLFAAVASSIFLETRARSFVKSCANRDLSEKAIYCDLIVRLQTLQSIQCAVSNVVNDRRTLALTSSRRMIESGSSSRLEVADLLLDTVV